MTSLLETHQDQILREWLAQLAKGAAILGGEVIFNELQGQAEIFVQLMRTALQHGRVDSIEGREWQPVRQFLEQLSLSRALHGSSAEETAHFIFTLKRPFFSAIKTKFENDSSSLAEETWRASDLLDKLGMHTVNSFLKGREQVIRRQQEELLELSTPVVKVWEGVLALPMIGTLDSARTQIVMESLLQRIVETGSEIAIIDITGVPTVDTLVAQYLLKTVTAIRLMGAECIISGIRPQIAQTIVHLGVDLHGVMTKANLSDALLLAFKRLGLSVTRTAT
ncbi:MAG TPA: STAS domain-containing protein [Pirellula sp.]|nr:STAS domain-containing protein [Pirellula sp.]